MGSSLAFLRAWFVWKIILLDVMCKVLPYWYNYFKTYCKQLHVCVYFLPSNMFCSCILVYDKKQSITRKYYVSSVSPFDTACSEIKKIMQHVIWTILATFTIYISKFIYESLFYDVLYYHCAHFCSPNLAMSDQSDKYAPDKRKSLNLSTPPAGVPGRTGGDSNNGDCPCPGCGNG